MKKLIVAALVFLGLTGVCQSSEAVLTREIDLESNFCKVVTLVMTHPEVIGGEVIEQVPIKKGVALSPDKGLVWYSVTRNLATTKGEDLWFKSHSVLNQNSLVILSKLDDESDFLNQSEYLVEFHKKKDGGTLVKMTLTLDAEASPFFLRIGGRVTTIRTERAIRTLIGEPLSKEKEE